MPCPALTAAAVPPQSMLGTIDWGDLMMLGSAAALFAWSSYLVRSRRSPRVLAASMTLLPIPLVVTVCSILNGVSRSLSVIAVSEHRPAPADYDAANADLVFGLLLAILATAPSYLLLAFGLLARVWHEEPPKPLPQPEGDRPPLPALSPGLAH